MSQLELEVVHMPPSPLPKNTTADPALIDRVQRTAISEIKNNREHRGSVKTNRAIRKMGLAVLTGGLAFVGSASATELGVDGSFENTSPSSNPIVKVGGTPEPAVGGGWTLFSTYLYSTLYTLPGPANSGVQYLRPYPSGTYGITQSSQSVTQAMSLTATTTLTPARIDSGAGRYTMSAWFSSYLVQGDYSDLTLEFL